jgi:hypothetical protein
VGLGVAGGDYGLAFVRVVELDDLAGLGWMALSPAMLTFRVEG